MKPVSLKFFAILLIFFFSGSAGLAYEIVWVRQLSLIFGVSIYAVSAVLVAFLGGLGIGAEFFGRKLNQGAAPIRLYALLEILLGVYVLLFPLIFKILEKLYLVLHPGTVGVSFYVIALRFILAVSVLIIPTILMGGTLPALARFFAKYESDAGRLAGKLYAVNTLGAMVGCFAAGFWMIEHLGLSGTLRVGAVINIMTGVIAWTIAGEPGWLQKAATTLEKTNKIRKEIYEHKWDSTLLLLFGVSGFSALALQVLWTRMLILLLNNTTYAFSLILSVFLFGIGSGSALIYYVIKKSAEKNCAIFAFFQIGIGIFAMLSLFGLMLNQYVIGIISALMKDGSSLVNLLPGGQPMAAALVFSFLIIFPCTLLMGGSFPLIVESLTSNLSKIGGTLGRVYAVNILGSVLGSLIAGYVLIPFIGIQKGLIAVSLIPIIGGGYLIITRFNKYRPAIAGLSIMVILPVILILIYKGDIPFLLNVRKLDLGSSVEFYREGPSATVLVSYMKTDTTVGRKPIRRLWINGDPIAGTFREALQLEKLQAHIPLLLHPDPKNALIICFGTGSTAGAAATHGLENVTAVDISPEVFTAAEKFKAGNLNIMSNPVLTAVKEDGRNFLLTTRRFFDFITSEPPPPSNAGIVSLYTTEYYQLVKKRLKLGGIVSQWVPLHHLSEKDFRILVASFLAVFPKANMWYTKWDAILIGAKDEIEIDLNQIAVKMKNPAVAESLRVIGITNSYQLVSNYMMGHEQMRVFTKDVRPVSDDLPVVEFTAPRIHQQGVTIKGANLAAVLKFRSLPKIRFALSEQENIFKRYFDSQKIFLEGQIELNYKRRAKAANYFDQALRLNPDNNDARYAYLSLNMSALYGAVSARNVEPGMNMLQDTNKMDIDGLFSPQLRFLKGMFFALKDKNNDAEREFKMAIRLDNSYFMAIINLAGLYNTRLGQPEKARELYTRALELDISENERRSVLNVLRRLT